MIVYARIAAPYTNQKVMITATMSASKNAKSARNGITHMTGFV